MARRHPVAANGGEHGLGVGLEQVGDEGIGVLRRKGVWHQPVGRKSPQIAGHDHVNAAVDGRSQYMAVVGVRQVEPGGDGPVSRHDGVGEVFVHDRAGPVEHPGVDIGAVGEKAAHPFGMSIGAPAGAKTGRIEYVGVQQRRRAGHRLLQPEFLIACGQSVERLAAAELGLAAPGENILGADAAV